MISFLIQLRTDGDTWYRQFVHLLLYSSYNFYQFLRYFVLEHFLHFAPPPCTVNVYDGQPPKHRYDSINSKLPIK